MSEYKFKNGDRAVINDQYMLPRPGMVGATGVVVHQVEEAPELMYIKLDNEDLVGNGPEGSWAVIDIELDKLES